MFWRPLLQRARHDCPVCGYRGTFRDYDPPTGLRRHAKCARCGALERHRLQWLVVERVLGARSIASAAMLHVAPEPFFRDRFRGGCSHYVSVDIERRDVDCRVDLTRLAFADASFDLVFASHVLEHIRDDGAALAELRRVLRPGGCAFLPVPIVCEATVEYPVPNPSETMHVRAPGPDYFDRMRAVFDRVDVFASSDFPARHQTLVLEDRSAYPRPDAPLRTPMHGHAHEDYVPVCHVR